MGTFSLTCGNVDSMLPFIYSVVFQKSPQVASSPSETIALNFMGLAVSVF